MNKHLVAAFFAALSFCSTAAVVEVADVLVSRRFPWNGKVDIEFTLSGDHDGAQYRVWTYCWDEVGRRSIPTTTLRYSGKGEAAAEFCLQAGRHHLVERIKSNWLD